MAIIVELLFTDTDSLVYKVSDPEFDNDVHMNRQYFDLSNYPPKQAHFTMLQITVYEELSRTNSRAIRLLPLLEHVVKCT